VDALVDHDKSACVVYAPNRQKRIALRVE